MPPFSHLDYNDQGDDGDDGGHDGDDGGGGQCPDDYVPPNFWQDASDNVQLHGKLSLRYHTMEHLKASLHKGP